MRSKKSDFRRVSIKSKRKGQKVDEFVLSEFSGDEEGFISNFESKYKANQMSDVESTATKVANYR